LVQFLDVLLLGGYFGCAVSMLAFEGLDDLVPQVLQPCLWNADVSEVVGNGYF
jgi:hypothetical protein